MGNAACGCGKTAASKGVSSHDDALPPPGIYIAAGDLTRCKEQSCGKVNEVLMIIDSRLACYRCDAVADSQLIDHRNHPGTLGLRSRGLCTFRVDDTHLTLSGHFHTQQTGHIQRISVQSNGWCGSDPEVLPTHKEDSSVRHYDPNRFSCADDDEWEGDRQHQGGYKLYDAKKYRAGAYQEKQR